MRKRHIVKEQKKRPPGAPRGNLNAARSVIPALRRLAKGQALPQGLERVCAIADLEAAELVSDKGGFDALSGAERLMIGTWAAARRAEMLIWHELLSRDAIHVNKDGGWDLAPGMQRLGMFLQAQQRALNSLGLARRARPVMSLGEYVAMRDAERAAEEARADD